MRNYQPLEIESYDELLAEARSELAAVRLLRLSA